MKSQCFTSLGIALALTMTGAAATLAEPANMPADVNNPTNSSINNAPIDSTIRHNSPKVPTNNTTSPSNRSNSDMPMNSVNTYSSTMTSDRDLQISPLAMEILCRDFPLNSRCANKDTARTATLPNSSSKPTNTDRNYPYRSETDRRPAMDSPTMMNNTNPAVDSTPSTNNTSPAMPNSGTLVDPMPVLPR